MKKPTKRERANKYRIIANNVSEGKLSPILLLSNYDIAKAFRLAARNLEHGGR